jgi:hypothetical protein
MIARKLRKMLGIRKRNRRLTEAEIVRRRARVIAQSVYGDVSWLEER